MVKCDAIKRDGERCTYDEVMHGKCILHIWKKSKRKKKGKWQWEIAEQ